MLKTTLLLSSISILTIVCQGIEGQWQLKGGKLCLDLKSPGCSLWVPSNTVTFQFEDYEDEESSAESDDDSGTAKKTPLKTVHLSSGEFTTAKETDSFISFASEPSLKERIKAMYDAFKAKPPLQQIREPNPWYFSLQSQDARQRLAIYFDSDSGSIRESVLYNRGYGKTNIPAKDISLSIGTDHIGLQVDCTIPDFGILRGVAQWRRKTLDEAKTLSLSHSLDPQVFCLADTKAWHILRIQKDQNIDKDTPEHTLIGFLEAFSTDAGSVFSEEGSETGESETGESETGEESESLYPDFRKGLRVHPVKNGHLLNFWDPSTKQQMWFTAIQREHTLTLEMIQGPHRLEPGISWSSLDDLEELFTNQFPACTLTKLKESCHLSDTYPDSQARLQLFFEHDQ